MSRFDSANFKIPNVFYADVGVGQGEVVVRPSDHCGCRVCCWRSDGTSQFMIADAIVRAPEQVGLGSGFELREELGPVRFDDEFVDGVAVGGPRVK